MEEIISASYVQKNKHTDYKMPNGSKIVK